MKTDHLSEMKEARQAVQSGMPNATNLWHAYIKKWSNKLYKKALVNSFSFDKLRQEVFVPIDTDKKFDNLYSMYPSDNNPIIQKGSNGYTFSETEFKFDFHHKGGNTFHLLTSIEDYEPGNSSIVIRGRKDLHSWERKFFFVEMAIRIKELQKTHHLTICRLSYKGVDLEIYRFYENPTSEGIYYIFPAKQLSLCPIEMDEKTILHLDTASLLLDMADDNHNREQIHLSLIKKIKLRTIELNIDDELNPVFWDEGRVLKAVKEYVKKGYDLNKSITYLHRSFMKSLRESFNKYAFSQYSENNRIFYQEHHRGKWTVKFCWGEPFSMVTKCDNIEYTLNFSSNNPNPYPIYLYLNKVEEYGNRWNQLTDYCKKEYLKYKRIDMLDQNLN